MASVSALASGSPMPVPSTAVVSAPRRSKGTKMRSMFSGEMPGPVSETTMLAWPVLPFWQEIVMLPPRWLYLTALEIRLTRTWATRCRSAWTARAGWAHCWMIRIERSAAIGAISSLVSSMTEATRTGSSDRLRSPDSIRAMSMSSLMSASRWRPAPRIRPTLSASSLAEFGHLQ